MYTSSEGSQGSVVVTCVMAVDSNRLVALPRQLIGIINTTDVADVCVVEYVWQLHQNNFSKALFQKD